jgi:hypothetical protein
MFATTGVFNRDHILPSVTPDISEAVVVTSVLLITGASSVVLVYSCDDSVATLISVSSAEDNDVKALTVSAKISVVVPKLDTEMSVVYDELSIVYNELSVVCSELSVVYNELPVVSLLESALVSDVDMELSDVLSVVPDSVVVNKSELILTCISPEPFSGSGTTSPLMSSPVMTMLPMPEPVKVLITSSVFRSVYVVIPEPSPEPVSKVISEEVLILESELDDVSDNVESVRSVL